MDSEKSEKKTFEKKIGHLFIYSFIGYLSDNYFVL